MRHNLFSRSYRMVFDNSRKEWETELPLPGVTIPDKPGSPGDGGNFASWRRNCQTRGDKILFKFFKFLLLVFGFAGGMGAVLAGEALEDSTSRYWQKVDEGLYYGVFDSPQKSEIGDSKITIIKINPWYYDFKLLSASEFDDSLRTARQWAKKFNLLAVVNAGMFQQDMRTSVGYMKNFDHVNNPRVSKENAFFAFNPVVGLDRPPDDSSEAASMLKPAQIIDRHCQDFEVLRQQYQSIFQSIRMISCTQKNVWSQQPQKWSMVVLGADKSSNILFIFTRSPYSVHDFINILLSLPISIYNAMYLEGGPEATLYFSANGIEFEKNGSYETGFMESNTINTAWPIPNVLGVVKKQRKVE